MPRLARLDAPGVIHHVIIRGIERRKIFRDNKDRNDMIDRLADLLPATKTSCYAWAFLSNHAHFLFRSGGQVEREELYSKSRQKVRSEARSVFCYWAVRELGVEGTYMAKRLKMSQPGVAYAIARGERIVKDNNFQMIE